MDFKNLSTQYKNELLDNVVPFWLNKSQDQEFGGYFTCLDREGNVYDTDKFIWLQAREVWLFSMLYNRVEQKPEWLVGAFPGCEKVVLDQLPEGEYYRSPSQLQFGESLGFDSVLALNDRH